MKEFEKWFNETQVNGHFGKDYMKWGWKAALEWANQMCRTATIITDNAYAKINKELIEE